MVPPPNPTHIDIHIGNIYIYICICIYIYAPERTGTAISTAVSSLTGGFTEYLAEHPVKRRAGC